MSSPLEPSARVSSPRWPIGSAGAIGLTLALILGHVAVIAGVGGALSRLFGLVLGGLRDRTGTLWASAVAHGLVWAVLGTARASAVDALRLTRCALII